FYQPNNVNQGPGTVKKIMQYRTLTTPYRRKHSDRPNVALVPELISSTCNEIPVCLAKRSAGDGKSFNLVGEEPKWRREDF
ncbi:MAG TPA: hypothetical protein VKG86_00185, partial [Terracidiphilus sp.]|nr:hypothetical protein [Terracidiphilus sp.]